MGCLNTKPANGNKPETVPENKNIKILLLGAGESGKSTIFKQMKIMHSKGFTKEECQSYRDTVHGNVIKAIKALTEAAQSLDIPIEEPDNRSRAEKILELDDDDILSIQRIWSPDLGHDISKLWQDNGIKKCYERRNEFQLDDSTQYYMSELDRISKLDYIPTQEDVLRTRVKTTGVVEMNYKMTDQNNKEREVQMMDVGGQRNERKKWIHCFEGVNAVIFVIAVSEYDGKCYEDNETPRMQESLDLFTETINSKWFVDTPIVLFMNKTDIFKEKVARSPISVMFPEYDGPQDYDSCLEYIKKKFCEKSKYPDKKIIAVPTAATDTQSLQNAFDAIKETLLASKPSNPTAK